MNFLTNIKKDTKQNIIVFAIYIVILTAFTIQSPYFFTVSNISAMLNSAVPLGLISISVLLCLLTGNLDMSLSMVASMAGVIWAALITGAGMNVWLAFVIALAFGVAAGIVDGILVAYLKLPAFIATYALMQVWKGIIYVITNGEATNMYQYETFKILGQTKVFGTSVTLAVVIMLLLFILIGLFLKYTSFGRSLFIIGGNKDAAVNIGINFRWCTCMMFVISALLSALAGLLFASRTASVQAVIGDSYIMQGVAAAVIGGAKIEGGKASVGMTFVGVLIVTAIQNGLNMAGVDSFYQFIATGIIVFAAVLIQTDRRPN